MKVILFDPSEKTASLYDAKEFAEAFPGGESDVRALGYQSFEISDEEAVGLEEGPGLWEKFASGVVGESPKGFTGSATRLGRDIAMPIAAQVAAQAIGKGKIPEPVADIGVGTVLGALDSFWDAPQGKGGNAAVGGGIIGGLTSGLGSLFGAAGKQTAGKLLKSGQEKAALSASEALRKAPDDKIAALQQTLDRLKASVEEAVAKKDVADEAFEGASDVYNKNKKHAWEALMDERKTLLKDLGEAAIEKDLTKVGSYLDKKEAYEDLSYEMDAYLMRGEDAPKELVDKVSTLNSELQAILVKKRRYDDLVKQTDEYPEKTDFDYAEGKLNQAKGAVKNAEGAVARKERDLSSYTAGKEAQIKNAAAAAALKKMEQQDALIHGAQLGGTSAMIKGIFADPELIDKKSRGEETAMDYANALVRVPGRFSGYTDSRAEQDRALRIQQKALELADKRQKNIGSGEQESPDLDGQLMDLERAMDATPSDSPEYDDLMEQWHTLSLAKRK